MNRLRVVCVAWTTRSLLNCYWCITQNVLNACVNLDEVWPLVYERKDHAVRALTKDYFEGVDYIIKADDTLHINVELENQSVTDGWKVRKDYYLTVSCLEHLVARKERRVFEVYRQVFHQAMSVFEMCI